MPPKTDKRTLCPVKDYAQKVLSGKIVAGKWVRLACQRHLDDLKSCHARGLYFDRDASEHAINSMQLMRHSKGEWAGQNIELGLWQKFCIGSIYGWKQADGTRRFRTAYKEVARKNGKSTEAAAVGMYMLAFDNEPGAEIYTAATKRDQARIVFDEMCSMTRKLPTHWRLRRDLLISAAALTLLATSSRAQPLAADAHSMDGLNPHCCIIDEVHAHKTRAVFDVLNTAIGSRRQPLIFEITTAGWDRNSVCWEHHDYAVRVLEGIIADDSFFAYIASLDDGDDWKDEKNWIKANPNLGVSVKLDNLREKAKKAAQIPAELNAFLRLHLNVWTEQADRWIDIEDWDECLEDYTADDLAGRDCYGGLDMSSTQDLSAYVLVFPPIAEGEKWKVLCWFWVPKNNIQKRVTKDRVPYDVWVRQGLIEATEGDVIDYNIVQARVIESATKYGVKEIAFDRFNVTQMVTNLMAEGLEMVQFGQGFVSMSAPTKTFGDLIVSKQIAHNGNDVLRWMVSNVGVEMDAAGNIKVSKSRSSEKIDGVVSTVMGIGRAIIAQQEASSYTASHGVVVL